jgi:hypothetical protein
VDVVFSNIDVRLSSLPQSSVHPSSVHQSSLRQSSLRESLPAHEQFARKLIELLRRVPETPSAAEVCVRRCYFGEDGGVREGFYCTLYVSGYGNDSASARQNWGVGLKLMGNAIVQLSASGVG